MKNPKKFLKMTLAMLMVTGCFVAMGSATVTAATCNEAQIFSFDSTSSWWGDVMPDLATTGQKEGAGYFTTQTGTIMCGDLSSTIDVNDAQALKMWVYISDASKLTQTGPQLYLDITHVQNQPLNTTSWTAAGLQTGWNELTFYMSSAVISNTNLTAIKFIHVRIDSTEAVTFGLDDLRKIVPVLPLPTITRLDTFETLNGHWGTGNLELASTGAPQGNSYIKVVTPDVNNAYIMCGSWPAADLSKYTDDGSVKIKVYVEDATKLVRGLDQGAIQLYDNATGIIAWDNISTQLETGWNELTLNISQATRNTANLASITTFRFFQYTNATGTFFGLDDLRIMNADAIYNEEQIFSFDNTSGWWGDVMPDLTTTGQKEGTGYFTTQTGTIMCGNLASTVDVSDAHALKMWVYISDASKLIQTGPQLYLDITHIQNEPLNTASWTVTGLQTGWNELAFYMSSAVISNTNLSAIKFIHVRINSTEAITFGLDDLRKIVPIQPAITQLDTFETLNGHWGTGNLELASTGAPQGNSYIKVVTPDVNNAYIMCGSWPVVDLSKYTDDGIVKIKVYVEDDTKLVRGLDQGAIQLYDNATGIIAWDNISTQLETGWNELTLNISQATRNTANLANITTFRFFQYTNATGTFFGLDDLRIMNISFATIKATVYANSILYNASGTANLDAIAAIMTKAAAGNAIKIVVLGDSITAGASASTGNDWASLVKVWWQSKFPSATVTLVNAGIGSTEAVFGVHRLSDDVLSTNPDLVIVDFGTNDYGLPYAQEAYEGIVRQLIDAEIATINFNVCPETGNNIQTMQLPINQSLGIPQISFRSAYYALATSANAPYGFTTDDIWTTDNVHPTTAGHALCAELINTFLDSIYDDYTTYGEPSYGVLPAEITANGYRDAVLFESGETHSNISVNLGTGWTANYHAQFLQLDTYGWQTSTLNSTITFTVTDCGYFVLFNAFTATSANLEIRVDGSTPMTIDYAYLMNGMSPYHVIHLANPGTHTITATMRANENVSNPWFGICAIGISNIE